jgi:hypothetical protein
MPYPQNNGYGIIQLPKYITYYSIKKALDAISAAKKLKSGTILLLFTFKRLFQNSYRHYQYTCVQMLVLDV